MENTHTETLSFPIKISIHPIAYTLIVQCVSLDFIGFVINSTEMKATELLTEQLYFNSQGILGNWGELKKHTVQSRMKLGIVL